MEQKKREQNANLQGWKYITDLYFTQKINGTVSRGKSVLWNFRSKSTFQSVRILIAGSSFRVINTSSVELECRMRSHCREPLQPNLAHFCCPSVGGAE